MSDLVFLCAKTPGGGGPTSDAVRRAVARLAPATNAGRPAREPHLLHSPGVLAALSQPPAGGQRPIATAEGGALCAGVLCGEAVAWQRPGDTVPDGSYALVRWDRERVELVSDVCATRTIWYVVTDELLLASTSQRALVMLLGSFALYLPAVAWVLSSGTLGPEASWDARIRRLMPDTRLVLDRRTWRTAEHRAPFDLTPAPGNQREHETRLREAVLTTLSTLDVDPDRWVLPLSGGMDSRVLLGLSVAAGLRPRCLTWTTRASLRKPLSDAAIARRLARHFGVDHELWVMDEERVSDAESLDRFVAGNEGRNDAMTGYTDGMELWAYLRDAGVDGVIRGDESCGWRRRPAGADTGRRQVGGAMVDDYPEGHVIRRLGLAPQAWPDRLRKLDDETLADYRLRLQQQGWLPIIAAGLSEPKARFVDVANPLLSRAVIATVRALPPESRRFARAFTDLAHAQAPGIPFARFRSIRSDDAVMADPAVLDLVIEELGSARMGRVLDTAALPDLLAALLAEADARPSAEARLRAAVKKAFLVLPTRLACRLAPRRKVIKPLPASTLAFRAALASKTVALFEQDAAAGTAASDATPAAA